MVRINRKLPEVGSKRPKVKRDNAKRRMSKEKNSQYNDFIREAHQKILLLVRDGARRFNKPEGEVRNHVFTKTRLSHPKELLWQAYVHVRAKELNKGKPKGERLRLKQVQRIARADQPFYKERPREEQLEWLRALKEHNATRNTQKRRNHKGEEVDHAHTINNFADEMQAAEMRYGLQAFFMGVRSDPQQKISPVILCSDTVKEFIALIVGKTPEWIAREFEMWSIHGKEGILGSSKRKNANVLKHECRHFIQMLLNIILTALNETADNIEMNYASYDTQIVARYGVRLVGWTYGDKVCNPGEISSTEELRKLHTALINKTCRWEAVPEEERAAIQAAAAAEPPRERSDKGKKRGPYKKRAAKDTADSVDDENAASTSSKARAKKTTAAKKQATKAASGGAPTAAVAAAAAATRVPTPVPAPLPPATINAALPAAPA